MFSNGVCLYTAFSNLASKFNLKISLLTFYFVQWLDAMKSKASVESL